MQDEPTGADVQEQICCYAEKSLSYARSMFKAQVKILENKLGWTLPPVSTVAISCPGSLCA